MFRVKQSINSSCTGKYSYIIQIRKRRVMGITTPSTETLFGLFDP
jgi:hypothetical protein